MGMSAASQNFSRYSSVKAGEPTYGWQEPVTDRTQADVDYAGHILALRWDEMDDVQKMKYSAGLKGCLNREDLERIENNIRIIANMLEIGIESSGEPISDIPDEVYFSKIKQNVEAIRKASYCVHDTTPLTPELPYNTWQKYNDIEQILFDVHEVVTSQFSYYAGEIYAGDVTGMIL